MRVAAPPCSARLLLNCKPPVAQVGTIVWHVAAHEIGHAIYGLDGVKGAIKVSTKTLLEEPRAELTALHTMTLLLPAGMLEKVSTCFYPILSATESQQQVHRHKLPYEPCIYTPWRDAHHAILQARFGVAWPTILRASCMAACML